MNRNVVLVKEKYTLFNNFKTQDFSPLKEWLLAGVHLTLIYMEHLPREPHSAAICKGVRPSVMAKLVSAPDFKSIFVHFSPRASSIRAEMCNGVSPISPPKNKISWNQNMVCSVLTNNGFSTERAKLVNNLICWKVG